MQPDSENPKLFISYSWSSSEHEEWVLKLAQELVDSGVHVILDKWDLREGNDAHAFMEQMVGDPTIGKVAMICDRTYVEKADGRKGGVGTETQIITPQIFADNQQQQNKYVAIVREHDDHGAPCRPVYFGSRIFIDFTNDQDYARSFEQLVRWVYGKPVHTRPPLGKKPAFLDDDPSTLQLSIAPSQMRAIEALRNTRPHAIPALRDFFDSVISELDGIKIDLAAEPFDDAVMDVVNGFQRYRNAIVDVFIAVANYHDDPECWRVTHRFFEKLLSLLEMRTNSGSFSEWDFDHFRIIAQELFLYLIAVNLKYERFEAVKHYTRTPYYVGQRSRSSGEPMRMFTAFQEPTASLNARNQRLHESRRTSPLGDLLKERSVGSPVNFNELMTADFLLYFLSRSGQPDAWEYWWPNTLVYLDRYGHGLEIFVRCRSTAFFERFRSVLGVHDKSELIAQISAMEGDQRSMPRWGHTHLSAGHTMGLNAISTLP